MQVDDKENEINHITHRHVNEKLNYSLFESPDIYRTDSGNKYFIYIFLLLFLLFLFIFIVDTDSPTKKSCLDSPLFSVSFDEVTSRLPGLCVDDTENPIETKVEKKIEFDFGDELLSPELQAKYFPKNVHLDGISLTRNTPPIRVKKSIPAFVTAASIFAGLLYWSANYYCKNRKSKKCHGTCKVCYISSIASNICLQ